MNGIGPIPCPECHGRLVLDTVRGENRVYECRSCGEAVTIRAGADNPSGSVQCEKTDTGGRNRCNGGVTGGVLHQYAALKPSAGPVEGGVTGVTGVWPTIANAGGRVGGRACVRARNGAPITRYTRYAPEYCGSQALSLSDWRNAPPVTGVLRPVTARGVGA